MLVGLPPGARHELAAMAHATAARRAGLPVVYVGADVPTADWIQAARMTRARAAVIGVPTIADREAARSVAQALRRLVPRVKVAFGGFGATTMRRDTVLSPGLREAVRDLQALVG